MVLTAKTSEWPDLLGKIIETAIAITEADFGTIQLLDDTGHLKIVASSNLPDWWVGYWNSVSGQGVCGAALQAEKRIIVEDVEQSPIFIGTPSLKIQRRAGIRAVQSTPLLGTAGQLLGMFSTHYRVPQRPDDKALKTLDFLVAHAASLIENRMSLLKSEELLRHAMEAARAGIWKLNPATGEFSASERALEIHGLAPGSVLTQDAAMVNVFPEDRQKIGEAVQHTMATGEPLRLEHRIVWPDGTLRWVEAYALPSNEDNVMNLIGFVRDITERKNIEEQLAESRKLLELALSGAELGTWDTDIASRRSRYDERYCAMLGYKTKEVEPTMDAWMRLVHPDDQATVNEAVRAHMAGETSVFEVEHRLRHKAGHWVWVLARGKITYDEEGRPIRCTGTHMDISSRKRVATEGSELLSKLAELLASREEHLGSGSTSALPSPVARSKTRLSGRNREILQLIAEGRSTAQMAEELGITESTAKTHRRNLMRKLGLRNKADLIRYAIKQGIVAA